MIEGFWRGLRLRSTPPLHGFTAHMLSREVAVRWGRARQELGYEPMVSVEEGLAELSQAS